MRKYVLRPRLAVEAMQVTESNQAEVHDWLCAGTRPEMFAHPTERDVGIWYVLRTDTEFRDFYTYDNDAFGRIYIPEHDAVTISAAWSRISRTSGT